MSYHIYFDICLFMLNVRMRSFWVRKRIIKCERIQCVEVYNFSSCVVICYNIKDYVIFTPFEVCETS